MLLLLLLLCLGLHTVLVLHKLPVLLDLQVVVQHARIRLPFLRLQLCTGLLCGGLHWIVCGGYSPSLSANDLLPTLPPASAVPLRELPLRLLQLLLRP